MISICIPVYNCDVTKLVKELHKQAKDVAIEFEIVLIDDDSDQSYKTVNRELSSLSYVKYKELPQNIGRAAIRNLLAEEATFRYLIFMDCDAEIYSPSYISRYISCCTSGIVCYGGCKYLSECPDPKYSLRWNYGIRHEDIDAQIRNNDRNFSFRTFNFLIDKEILQKVSFDNTLYNYGHEDTLYGIKLQERQIKIVHIDNPLIHTGLDTADVFIKKTESGIRNLIGIQQNMKDNSSFTNSVKLLRAEKKIARWRLTPLFVFLYKISKKRMLQNLKGERPNLFIFSTYKLGYLCSFRKKTQKETN